MRLAANAVLVAHTLARQIIKNGDIVVDATAGNGNDTSFLASLVGPTGHVYAFDIQEQAIFKTKEKLHAASLESRVTLIHDGHQKLDTYITRPLKLIIFNLGYLPKGDKSVVTKPATTLKALEKALSYLQDFGVAILTIYTGHAGGQEEWQVIKSFLHNLPKEEYDVVLYKHLNRNKQHPFTVMVQRIVIIEEESGL